MINFSRVLVKMAEYNKSKIGINESGIGIQLHIKPDIMFTLVNGCIMSILELFGIFVIIITFIILVKRKEKSSTECLFVGISVSDFFIIFTSLMFYSITIYTAITPTSVRRQPAGLMTYFPIFNLYPLKVLQLLSIAVAIERNFAVIKPFQFRTIWTPRVGMVLTISCYILAVPVSLLSLTFSDIETTTSYIQTVVTCISICVVAVSTITTLYVIKHRNIQIAPAVMQHAETRLKKEKRQTKVLIGLALLFLLFNGSSLCISIWFIVNPRPRIPSNTNMETRLPMIALAVGRMTYSVLNCIVFIFTNKSYRIDVKNMFKICRE